jgi:hypothetical protein
MAYGPDPDCNAILSVNLPCVGAAVVAIKCEALAKTVID